MIVRSQATDNANRLVGRFLQHFAALERAIDDAVAKILGLAPGAAEVVVANMAFYNKVETLFASEKELAALPDETREEKLRTTRSRILALNDQRVIAAHCSYDAVNNGTAVQFRRVVAKGELKISDIVWTEGDVERKCAHVMELVGAVGALVAEMKPFELMADASDPRNVAVLYMAGII